MCLIHLFSPRFSSFRFLQLIAKRKLAVRRKLTLAAYKAEVTKKAANSVIDATQRRSKLGSIIERSMAG